MTVLEIVLMAFLVAVATLAAYIQRVYSEFGKILSHEEQEHLNAWEERIEPHLGLNRDHAILCASVLKQLAFGMSALELGAIFFIRPTATTPITAGEIGQAVLAVVLFVMFANHLVPSLLFNRTRGQWTTRLRVPIRVLLWTVTPVTALIRFFFSIASLAEAPPDSDAEPSPDVNSLIVAGEEEGILEISDRELVRSVVEFGDKLVREVMTPRPEIFAIPETTTLAQFLELLRERVFSRVPVYADTLDNITGLAFARDLLQVADNEAHTRTVKEILRPAVFVPETKRGYELLREMQREKQHMRIVIDEYGSVAGVVTIEDLLEEIVGTIRDEHEENSHVEEPQREAAGTWLVPGNFPARQLADLIGEKIEPGDTYEAATLSGLISEIAGRIPASGETIRLEPYDLTVEVLASTGRRVERVRVYPPKKDEPEVPDEE